MATYTDRGSGTPATTGTTWASTANAVDGTPPANPGTLTTMTNATASAVATIEVSGYDFSTVIGASDTLNSVTVRTRHQVNNTGRFASVAVTCWDGATQIGTSQALTLATGIADNDKTFSPTLAQLRSATFKIRVTITGAASTQSRIWSLDHVDVVADYTPAVPSITQAAYRFYADGTESGSTALAAENTAYTADVTAGDVSLLVRAQLQSTTAVAVAATDDFQLQVEKNASGTWSSMSPVDTYSEANVAINSNIGSGFNVKLAQAFTGDGRRLVSAGFWVRKVAPAGSCTAVLYAISGSMGSAIPTGAALATSSARSQDSFQTTSQWEDFSFDGSFTLGNGTNYFISLETATGQIAAGTDNTSPTHPGNQAAFSASWVNSSADLIFRVFASDVIPFASANLTDGGVTTNRLTAGTGSFVAGKVSEIGVAEDLGWSANNYTEVLYAVTLKQANLANGDTLRFRVLYNGATTGMTYTQTPTINVTRTYPKIDTFTEAFTNLTAWTTIAGTPTITAGQLQLDCVVTPDEVVQTVNVYDLTESSVYCRVIPPSVPTTMIRQFHFDCWIDASNYARMTIQRDTVAIGTDLLLKYAGGASGATTYNATTHAYLRLRLTGTTLSLDTSPDGSTWTNDRLTRTITTPQVDKLKSCVIRLTSHQQAADATDPQAFFIPSINTVEAAAGGRPKVYLSGAFTTKPLKVWSGSAWGEKPVKVWTGSTWKTLT